MFRLADPVKWTAADTLTRSMSGKDSTGARSFICHPGRGNGGLPLPVYAGLVLVVVVTLGVSAVAGPATASGTVEEAVTIDTVTYSGDDIATTPGDRLYIWRSGGHEFSVHVRTEVALAAGEVCLRVSDAEGVDGGLACQQRSFSMGSDTSVGVSVDQWPEELTGNRTVEAVVRNASSGATLARYSMPLTVLEREGDADNDGLANEDEVAEGAGVFDPDTDGDGLDDGPEVHTFGTSPTSTDADADGLGDGSEVSTFHTDPTRADTDGDGLPDGREVELGTVPTRADTDGDGLSDGAEMNTYQTSPTNVDTDGDGLPDGAEVDEYGTNPIEADTDDDGLQDGEEATLYGTDPTQVDTDGDALSDVEEVTEYDTDPTDPDTDGDGLDDAVEVRQYDTDPLVADTDSDGVEDGLEVELGSDPTNPGDTAEPGPVRRSVSIATDRPVVAGAAGVVALTIAVTLAARRYGDSLAVGRVSDSLRGQADTDATETVAAPADRTRAGERPDDGGAPPAVDANVLTNGERVQRLLDEHDGRMLQSDMVEEADWSKATVSRVLSRMEEDGAVTRVDIGKGNLVARPDDEPTSASSPFSE